MKANLYEAMFLVDSARGGGNFPAVVRHIAGLLKRHGAQIERIEKWSEFKLAYPIRGVERGIYILVYFRLGPERVAELRRAVYMSEEILRLMIVKEPLVAEVSGELYDPDGQRIEPQEAAAPAETQAEPAAEAQSEQGTQKG